MTMTPISAISDFAMVVEAEAVATEQTAVHHHRPPLPSNLPVPAMVRVHVGARRNQFSTFDGPAGATINPFPFRRSRPHAETGATFVKSTAFCFSALTLIFVPPVTLFLSSRRPLSWINPPDD